MAKAKAKKKTAGRCVFCDSTGLSKEHIWADWLAKIVPSTPDNGQMLLRADRSQDGEQIVHEPRVYTRQGSMNQRKLRNVCKECNNGWMSCIVDGARPIAEALILDKAVTIDAVGQIFLIGWIAMTTIMAEFTDRESVVIPVEHRKHLMKRGVPPYTWTVMIGRYSGVEWRPIRHEHHATKYYRKDLPGPARPDKALKDYLQISTGIIGDFITHTVSASDYRVIDAARNYLNSRELVRLWPPVAEKISWPVSPKLADSATRDVASGFYRTFIGRHSVF